MRFSVATVVALAGLSIASPVGEVNKRADAVSLLSDLYATVQVYTGAISTPMNSQSVKDLQKLIASQMPPSRISHLHPRSSTRQPPSPESANH
jgi:hypothetical protein